MKSRYFILAYVLIIILIVGIIVYRDQHQSTPTPQAPVITSFEACAAAGYPVQESYPRRCAVPNGPTFTETISPTVTPNATPETESDTGNELIRVTSPRPRALVSSPLIISGQARGNWFFEASFPIRLEDTNGKTIAEGHAEAQSDWMTTEFVPFSATLTFVMPGTRSGNLVLMKDNPSGLPEHDDKIVVPVRFKQ